MSSNSIYDPIAEALDLNPIPEFYENYDSTLQSEAIYLPNGSGILNSFYGKSHTDELKKEFSIRYSGDGNPMYGRSAVSEQNLRWYNDGEKNIYVSQGTQPKGFFRGRINMKRKPHSKEHREKLSKANKGHNFNKTRSVTAPNGKVFNSIKEAAEYCNLTASQFRYRKVKNGNWIIN